MNPINRERPLPQIVIDAGEDVSLLKAAIRYPDYEVREAAAWVLGMIGKYECLAPLSNALKDPDSIVREAAARALGNVNDLPNINRKIGLFEDTPDDVSALNELTRALKDREYRVRAAAATSLINFGRDVDNVQEPMALNTEVEPINPQSLPSMYQPYGVSSEVEKELAPKKVYPPLLRNKAIPQLLIDADFNFDEYRELLKNKETELREAVAWALGVMADPEGTSLLINALKDTEPVVRESAARSLGQLKYRSDTKEAAGRFEDKREDHQAADSLQKALKDKELRVRSAAAAALANFGKPEIAKQLLTLLKDTIPNMRAAAATGLGGCPYPEVVPALILRLKDDDFWTRLCAARSLGKLHDPIALEFLKDALHDQNSSVRQNAVIALTELGSGGVGEPSFWKKLSDEMLTMGSLDPAEEVQAAAQQAMIILKKRL